MFTPSAISRKALLPIALAALAAVSTPAAAVSAVEPNQRIDFSLNPFNDMFVGPAFRISGLFQLTAPARVLYSFATTDTGFSFSMSIRQQIAALAPVAAAAPPVSPSAPVAASAPPVSPPAPATAPEQPAAPAKPYEFGFSFEYKPQVPAAGTMSSLLFASTQPAAVVDMALSTSGQFTDVNVQGGEGRMTADISVQSDQAVLPVPEPLEWMFMTSGLLAAVGFARRRAARAG
jgi:hypothetical protein